MSAGTADPRGRAPTGEPARIDAAALQKNFELVAVHGDQVAAFFYADLFSEHPLVRKLFPADLSAQRGRLLAALGHIVSHVGDLDALVSYLQRLGRDHRKFNAVADHYPAVGASLLATLKRFSGPAWTAELAADWTAAYGLVSRVMIEAAEEAAKTTPPFWTATVLTHEQRSTDIAVLTVRPDQRLPYIAGQSLTVEAPAAPGRWRPYSPANAPRPDGSIELHVRAVDAGAASTALVCRTRSGDTLRLGAAVGDLTLDRARGHRLLLVAGGTGLAPLRALIEEIAACPEEAAAQYRVHLLVGARSVADLYDLPALGALADRHRWLTVTPVVSGDDPGWTGRRGLVGEAAAGLVTAEQEVYVCGPAPMVVDTFARLAGAGVPPACIFREGFDDLPVALLDPARHDPAEPAGPTPPVPPGRDEPASAAEQRLEVMVRAQEFADQTVALARGEAARILQAARDQAARIRSAPPCPDPVVHHRGLAEAGAGHGDG